MARVHRLQEVESFRSAHLADNDPFRPHAQAVAHEVAHGDLALTLEVRGPRFETHHVRLLKLKLRRVLAGDDALVIFDELGQAVQQRRLAGAGTARYQHVAADAAELQLQQSHVVRLETRPPNLEGQGQITMRDLVRNCLRMRPERIIVGEVRGPEAFDLLQAMNTGHDGSMGTLHANSPRECLSRIESMITMGGYSLPSRTIREMICSSVDVIIQAQRLRDGSRRITHITEVMGMEGDVIITQDIILYDIVGEDPAGKLIGRHRSTGIGRPRFWERARYYNEEGRLAAALDAMEAKSGPT